MKTNNLFSLEPLENPHKTKIESWTTGRKKGYQTESEGYSMVLDMET